MTLKLIKEYDKQGKLSYYTTQDDKVCPNSTKENVHDALEAYDNIKLSFTQSRIEVLQFDEI